MNSFYVDFIPISILQMSKQRLWEFIELALMELVWPEFQPNKGSEIFYRCQNYLFNYSKNNEKQWAKESSFPIIWEKIPGRPQMRMIPCLSSEIYTLIENRTIRNVQMNVCVCKYYSVFNNNPWLRVSIFQLNSWVECIQTIRGNIKLNPVSIITSSLPYLGGLLQCILIFSI